MTTEDVVINGDGMTGLTTSAYLVRAGYTVRVYEQHTLPGGFVSSFERKGFAFPAGPISFGSNGIIFSKMNELGLMGRLQIIRARHQISCGAHDIPIRNPNQTRQDFKRCFSEDKKALRRYFRWVDIGGDAFRDFLTGGIMFGRSILKTLLSLVCKHPLSPWVFWVAGRQV